MKQAGCDVFLTKPIDIDELVERGRLAPRRRKLDPTARRRGGNPLRRAGAAVGGACDPGSRASRATSAWFRSCTSSCAGCTSAWPRCAELEARSDYREIADFAHWLRGSAGSMGYDAFTTPAAELEAAAKDAKAETVATLLNEVREWPGGSSRRMKRRSPHEHA